MEGDGKRLIHLGKSELSMLPGKRVGGIGCRLVAMPFLERWILCTPLEEVLVGTVQVAKGLLNGHRGDIRKPGMGFLEVRQLSREIIIGKLLPMLGIGSFAGVESPIVHKAATPERLRQYALLIVGWVEPVLVCPLRLAHCIFPFTNMGILSHTCQYTNI